MARNPDSWVGLKLAAGRFRVERKLGEGGMGFVYKAQDTKLGRFVVIKVPRAAMLVERQFRERFVRELRSLVKLDHPHIVAIQDYGQEDKIPFAVMQFLGGGELAARMSRDPSQLDAWLPAIARALDYVHAQGYVHRDVKPGNILFDEEGHAFLSDFGVAKVVSDTQQEYDNLTGTGMAIGTSDYMAPELIMGKEISGSIDQYALAITVYEALAGKRPFTGNSPSAVMVAHTTEQPAAIDGLPAGLQQALLRGMAKDPADRYANCTAFAEAISASLVGASVAASSYPLAPPSPPPPIPASDSVRLDCPECGKSLRATAQAAGRSVTCPGCGVKLRVAEDLSGLAVRDPAAGSPGSSKETMILDPASGTSKPGLRPADSGSGSGSQLPMGTDATQATIDTSRRVRTDPAHIKAIGTLLHRAWDHIPESLNALVLFLVGLAVVVLLSLLGLTLFSTDDRPVAGKVKISSAVPDSPATVGKSKDTSGGSETQSGSLVGFNDQAQQAKNDWKKFYAEAQKLKEEGKYSEGILAANRALNLAEMSLPDSDSHSDSLSLLAMLSYKQGNYAEAEPLFEQALAIVAKTAPSDHPDAAIHLGGLALLYLEQGKYAQAEPLFERALAIVATAARSGSDLDVEGSNHPDAAIHLGGLALLYLEQGKYAQAEPLFERALEIDEQALGPNHPRVATDLNNLALLYLYLGKYAEAEPLLKRALAIAQKDLPSDHPDRARHLGGLAWLYQEQDRESEAEQLLQQALAIDEKALGPDHPSVAIHLGGLAELYLEQGKYAEAEPLFKRALAIDEQALGPNHPSVAIDLNGLAWCYLNQDNISEAAPLLTRALAIAQKALPSDHPDMALHLGGRAWLYLVQDKAPEAEPLFKQALTIAEQALPPDHLHLAEVLASLATCYLEQGKYAEAEPLLKRELAITEKKRGSNHVDVIAVLHNLARLYRKTGREASALKAEQRAAKIRALQNSAQGKTVEEKVDRQQGVQKQARPNFTAHTISTDADGAQSVFAADLDSDGDIDVLSASGDDNEIAWYENDGRQNFTAHTITTDAKGARSVFAADLDSDGDTDVLSASGDDNKIAWYENDLIEAAAAKTQRQTWKGAEQEAE